MEANPAPVTGRTRPGTIERFMVIFNLNSLGQRTNFPFDPPNNFPRRHQMASLWRLLETLGFIFDGHYVLWLPDRNPIYCDEGVNSKWVWRNAETLAQSWLAVNRSS